MEKENNTEVKEVDTKVEVKKDDKIDTKVEVKKDDKIDTKVENNDEVKTITTEEVLNKTINGLNNEISNLNKTNKSRLTKKDNEIAELKEKINNLTNNYEDEVKSQFNVEDKDYFNYTINQERTKEENKGKSLKDIINIVKEKKPSIFSKNSTPGRIPSNSSSNEIGKEKYRSLTPRERFALLRKGINPLK